MRKREGKQESSFDRRQSASALLGFIGQRSVGHRLASGSERGCGALDDPVWHVWLLKLCYIYNSFPVWRM